MEKKKGGSQGGPNNKGGMKIFRKLPQMKVDECLINLVSTLVLQFVWISLKCFTVNLYRFTLCPLMLFYSRNIPK